jgi:biopolymer transport protein TolR
MSLSRREKFKPVAQINVVPYIDVMLVLLVIFMVTAPMMNPSQIDLPSVGKSSTPAVAPLEVIIHKDSSIALRDHAKSEQEISVTREQLSRLIQQRQSNAEQAVVIAADKNVRYEEVMTVMDMLQKAHIKKVGLLTKAQ